MIAPDTAKFPAMISFPPTLLSVGEMRFLIMDAPRQSNMHLYIKEMKKCGVTDVVRVCERTYSNDELKNAGISDHDMQYQDGHPPSPALIDQWLNLVRQTFFTKEETSPATASDGKKTIAVHCVAGLGRAPSLVAIALIEFAGMDAVDAVSHIRKHRRGAINEKQLNYLEGYRRHVYGPEDGCACSIL